MRDEPIETFASVWDALEETPEAAASMRLRSELTIAVCQAVKEWPLTQAQAARRLGVTQTMLDDLLLGHVDRLSLDALVGLAHSVGLSVGIEVKASAA